MKKLAAEIRAAFDNRESEKAMKLATRLVEMAPNEPGVHMLRGNLHSAMRMHAKAVKDFSAAIKLEPPKGLLAEAYQERGESHF